MDADVVIIGCGSTGISTALYLAQEHGRQAVVLEANHASWGCSSRSGGQGQNASGRLTRTQWIARWGLEVARQLDREIRTGFENFRQLTRQVDCDAFDGDHLYVAHRPEKMVYLRNEARVRREAFGYDNRLLSAEELRRDYCDERDAAGALLEQESVGIHPLKFTFGLIAKARALGVKVHPASPVQGWETIGGVHHLPTPGGIVRAKRVAVCTGGYTGQGLNPMLRNKLPPTTLRWSTPTCSAACAHRCGHHFGAWVNAFCTSGTGCVTKSSDWRAAKGMISTTQRPRHLNSAVQSGVATIMPAARLFASSIRMDKNWWLATASRIRV
jgi:glycine/D-amino acid oxidase-like deaminating enzyme